MRIQSQATAPTAHKVFFNVYRRLPKEAKDVGKTQKWAESQKWDLKSQKRQQRGLPRVVPEGKRFTRLARAKNGTKNRVIPGDLALP